MFNSIDKEVVAIVLIFTVVMLILITTISIIIYKYSRNQNLHLKGIAELEEKFNNSSLKSQIEIQEQTFQNISLEIHDNIGLQLTVAKLNLNTLDYGDLANLKTKVEDSISIISDAISDLRDISRSMSSEIIFNNGFLKAVEYEVEQLNKSGVFNIILRVTGEPVFIEVKSELLLFRVVQEAINNIVKHAEATKIELSIYYEKENLCVSISDNGNGFDKTMSTAGHGIRNMKARTQLLNGEFDISPNNERGVTVSIKIPLNGG